MGGGIKDSRYKKTEEKFLAVFFDNPNCTMKQLAQKAGVAHSTIYTHHHSIHEIVPDCERGVLAEYEKIIGEKLQVKNVKLKTLYFDMLIFIVKNRQVFEMFVKFGDREVVMKMILKLEPKIKMPKKMLRICVAEITEIIFEWGERGFSEEEIEKVFVNMIYLTLSARNRLEQID